MAINFNQDSVVNLHEIPVSDVRSEVEQLMVNGESILMAFQTIRDQVIFTDKRIISIDVQGLTGKRKSYATLPYSKIQYFAIQTPGLLELFPDTELFIMFSNTFTAKFEFRGDVDVARLGRVISEYVL